MTMGKLRDQSVFKKKGSITLYKIQNEVGVFYLRAVPPAFLLPVRHHHHLLILLHLLQTTTRYIRGIRVSSYQHTIAIASSFSTSYRLNHYYVR